MPSYSDQTKAINSWSTVGQAYGANARTGSRADCATRFGPGWWGGLDFEIDVEEVCQAKEGGFYGAFGWMFVWEGAL
jgi:hypothetical protein